MSLSKNSDEELGSLLSEYGIKHGPIMGSTRHLYEKQLEKAMEQASVKTSSDKTYYREEEEEVTCITYHNAARKRSANTTAVQVTYSSTNHMSERSVEPTGKKSTGSLWKMILVLLPLAVLSAVCYYAYAYIV